MNVSLYQCFNADQRVSMDVYADGVRKALTTSGVEVDSFTPCSKLEYFKKSVWVMRYLRYQHYPRQVTKESLPHDGVHHVMDHGYAHLFPSLEDRVNCISVHDLIPLLTWKGVIKSKPTGSTFNVSKPRLNMYSLGFIKYYDHVITISQSTSNDLQTYLNISPEKITVIPPVIDDIFHPSSINGVNIFRVKYNIDDKTKWVMISGCEFYKNHRTSLLVLQSLLAETEHNVRIIKTGKPSPEFDGLLNELGLQEHVTQLFLDDMAELPFLYTLVDCLLFPSLYEGFGMPVAEALACGTPVVTSTQASLPEAGQPLAIQHDCFDVVSMTKSVDKILNDQTFTDMILSESTQWAERFRPESIGKRLRETYAKITKI